MLVTLLPFQMATAGCALQADSDAAQDDSASTYQLVELVKQHSLAHLQQGIPDLLGQIFSATGFLFSEESGRGLAKVTASSCLSTSIALCTLDAINPFFEFANGVCDVDPETRCANGGPTWADLERRKPDLTQVLEESKSFMTNQTFWAPIFAELRLRGHDAWVERLEPWTTGSTDVASSVPPLAAGTMYRDGVGSSGNRLVRFVALMGMGVTAIVAIGLYIRSATDVTNQDFVPNVVATPGSSFDPLDPDDVADREAEVRRRITALSGLPGMENIQGELASGAHDQALEEIAALEEILEVLRIREQALLRQANQDNGTEGYAWFDPIGGTIDGGGFQLPDSPLRDEGMRLEAQALQVRHGLEQAANELGVPLTDALGLTDWDLSDLLIDTLRVAGYHRPDQWLYNPIPSTSGKLLELMEAGELSADDVIPLVEALCGSYETYIQDVLRDMAFWVALRQAPDGSYRDYGVSKQQTDSWMLRVDPEFKPIDFD